MISNGSSISGVDNVFTSIDKKSEERRKVIEAANLAMYDPVPEKRSMKKKTSYSDYDDSDEEVVVNGVNGNGVTEEKKTKPKKVKKPKVTVQEEAAKIDAADLASFLSDVTVSEFIWILIRNRLIVTVVSRSDLISLLLSTDCFVECYRLCLFDSKELFELTGLDLDEFDDLLGN